MKNFSPIAFGFLLPFQLKKMKSFVRFFTVHACVGLAPLGHAAIAADSRAYGQRVAAQRDGKIVVAGYAEVGRGDQFALVRYNSDGSLDTSLNSSGKVTTAIGTGSCKGEGVASQDDGKNVVAGDSFNAAGQCSFTVLRYDAAAGPALLCYDTAQTEASTQAWLTPER